MYVSSSKKLSSALKIFTYTVVYREKADVALFLIFNFAVVRPSV